MIDNLILDVDGVLTTGHFIYSIDGKTHKVFGAHDKDGLKLIAPFIKSISFITADETGFDISYARICKDWGYDTLSLVKEGDRLKWIKDRFDIDRVAYIGDGIHDAPILKKARLGIAPKNARIEARKAADYVTPSRSGEGAVLDACIFIVSMIDGDRNNAI